MLLRDRISIILKIVVLALAMVSCDEKDNSIKEPETDEKRSDSDYEKIMDNIIEWNTYAEDDSNVSKYIQGLKDDGSWSDINYEDVSKGWEPQIHYHRIIPMTYAYINPQSVFYKSDVLYDKIIKGLMYWLDELNIRSPHWYHNQINEPISFGLIMIFMRKGDKKLSSAIENKIIERWKNNESDPEKMTGANRTETALHWMYFACLTEDEELLNTAIYYLFEPLQYVEDEGFQVDGCFFQHGHQLYIGGYGEVLLESVLQSAVCITGTKYTLSEEKLKILRDYVLNSWSNVIRGEVMHWNAIGRQLTRPDFLRYPERRIPIIEKMIVVDEQNAFIYNQILNRLKGISAPDADIIPRHIHFFRGDYTLHVEKGYSFSMRMTSTRTARQEKASGENKNGYYLSYGSTAITRTGKEYLDLMPLWDWNKIPGVTSPKDFLYKGWYEGFGPSTFAGGVSNSIYGCTAYQYYDDSYGVNTGAQKGYFFFTDAVVCLGAGIYSSHPNAQTTVNQCWGANSFIAGTDKVNTTMDGDVSEYDVSNYSWILHDGIGYYFPDNQKIVVENKEKEGNWRWISNMQEDKTIHGKVFTLGIEHPGPVQDAYYSYIVIPNSTSSSLSTYLKNKDIEIFSNTDSVQVVYSKSKDLYECIFYRACTYKGDIEIRSTQPCAVLIQKQDNNYIVHIADPAQTKGNMTIGIRGKDMNSMAFGSCDFTGINDQYAGMTKEFIIQRK